MYNAPTKAAAVIDQAREELAHRPREFFRGLRTLMGDAKFQSLVNQLLARFDARRDEQFEELPPPTAEMEEGTYEEAEEPPEGPAEP